MKKILFIVQNHAIKIYFRINCIVFNHLEEFYPEGVRLFKQMLEKHKIELPSEICSQLTDSQMETMLDTALGLSPLWENALGKSWQEIATRDRLRQLYRKM